MCFPDKADGSLFQGVATKIGNLLSLNYGLLFGITSSQILLYQSEDTPLSRIIGTEAASWLGAYLCLGGILGSLIFGFVSDKIGPKTSLLVCGLLQMGCWFCILFGYNIDHIYSSRLVGGMAAGGAFTVLPMYIRETAEEKNSRQLVASIDSMRNVGIVLGFALASYAPYIHLPLIGVSVAFLFTMCFPFMPESPYYFVRKGDFAMMEKSLRWFRGIRKLDDRDKPEFLEEVSKFVELQKKQDMVNESTSPGYQARLIVISAVLVITSQFCGVFLILNYCETLFREIVSPIPAHWSAITLAGAQLAGSIFGGFLQEKIKRRILLCMTSLLSGLCLIVLAVLISYGSLLSMNAAQLEWCPLGFLAAHIFIANVGFYPLTHVVIFEMAPVKMKRSMTTLTMGFLWLLALLTVKFYYILMDLIGFTGLLWIFASVCLFEIIIVIFLVPETRGKTLAEISAL